MLTTYPHKIKYKILLFFLVIGIVPFSVSVVIEYFQSIKTLKEKAQTQLRTVRELKRKEIEGYFQHSHLEIGFFAQSATVIEAIQSFKTAFNQYDGKSHLDENKIKLAEYYHKEFAPKVNVNKTNSINIANFIPTDPRQISLQSLYLTGNSSKFKRTKYSDIHEKFHPIFSEYLASQGYYDLFLVDDATGDILYSVKKEIDFSTNLLNGPYAETNLGKLFKQIRYSGEKNKAVMCDYERYAPSFLAPAAFIAAPVYDLNKKIGTIILQIPIEKIDAITTSKKEWREEGLGETGESYILGKDCKMRTNSRFLIESPSKFFKLMIENNIPSGDIELMKQYQTSVLFQTTCNENVLKATNKQKGVDQVTDYRGKQVLSAYTPLSIPEVNWVFLAEIDANEAYAPVYAYAKRSIFVLILAVAVVIFATFYMARLIYAPILSLTNASKQLSNGVLGVQIPVTSKDELGFLGNTFNEMSLSFKNQQDEILKKNELLEMQKLEITIQAENLKQLNEEVTQINNHLDELVKNRTLALEIQNNKLAEYAFLNSHKLRAPVATILGLVSLIHQAKTVEEKLQCVDLLGTTTLELDKVIKEIQMVINTGEFNQS